MIFSPAPSEPRSACVQRGATDISPHPARRDIVGLIATDLSGPAHPAQTRDLSTAWRTHQLSHPLISHARPGADLESRQRQTARRATREACGTPWCPPSHGRAISTDTTRLIP